MRIILIHNPGAGRQGAGAAKLTGLLRDAGHEVGYHSCKDEHWERALELPAALVVVAGGDGTVARVARRMVGRGIPVGLLPSGTANNIARTLGLVGRPFEELVRGWDGGRRVKLDVGVASGPWGERYFIEGVGAGLFATLLSQPESDELKKRPDAVGGALRRLRQAAAGCEPTELAATLDGEDISGRYVLLEAVNLPYVGPNLFLAPDSQPGDGQFDVVLVTEAERGRLLEYLDRWQENRERLAVLPSRRGARLQIDWTGFDLHIDDKLQAKKTGPVEARLGGATVEFFAPDAKRSA